MPTQRVEHKRRLSKPHTLAGIAATTIGCGFGALVCDYLFLSICGRILLKNFIKVLLKLVTSKSSTALFTSTFFLTTEIVSHSVPTSVDRFKL